MIEYEVGDEVTVTYDGYNGCKGTIAIITGFKCVNVTGDLVYWVKKKDGTKWYMDCDEQYRRNNDMEHSFCVIFLKRKYTKKIKVSGLVEFCRRYYK